MSVRKYTDSYTKPKTPPKPRKPRTPKSYGQPARPYSNRRLRSNTAIPGAQYDPRQGPLANPLKSGKGGALNAVGVGGMFQLSQWAKQKTR